MIVPSIDLMKGHAVQLRGGRELVINAGDPRPLAEKFGRIGEVAVIDLDAAMCRGSNATVIKDLLQLAPCRVGGGIRDVKTAIHWLDSGARKVILGTAAKPEIIRELPRERVIVALDALDGEVVVDGWQTKTSVPIEDRIDELREYVAGFLITMVEREGRLVGADMNRMQQLASRADGVRITAAGGVATVDEIAQLDRLGIEAQVGMALYSGRFDLADSVFALLNSDRSDQLIPTVVAGANGRALGLAYSNIDSLRVAINDGVGAYYSRQRGLWIKGALSGNTQRLLAVDVDCDRDTLRFTVEQRGTGFCHQDTATCWGPHSGLAALEARVIDRLADPPTGSYTARLIHDSELLSSKITEEAAEFIDATDPVHIAEEAADLLYFVMVRLQQAGISTSDVEAILDKRALNVTRRPGNAKTFSTGARL